MSTYIEDLRRRLWAGEIRIVVSADELKRLLDLQGEPSDLCDSLLYAYRGIRLRDLGCGGSCREPRRRSDLPAGDV